MTAVLRPRQVAEALEVAYDCGRPVMLWGPPGVGKSSLVAQMTERRKIDLIDIRLAQVDAVDIRGLPFFKEGKMTFAIPDIYPTSGKGVIFFDELPAAPQLNQNVARQIILERKIGDWSMPPGWLAMCAGNRRQDKSATFEMPKMVANSLLHIEVRPDIDDFCEWGARNGIRFELIAFLRFREELLCKTDMNAPANPSPRSWSFVSQVLEMNAPPAVEVNLITAAVGEGPASEFVGFLKTYKNIPKISSIIKNPSKEVVPTEPSVVHALVSCLSRLIKPEEVESLLIYLKRLPAEYTAICLLDAGKKNKKIAETAAYKKWIEENPSVLKKDEK